jgi:signal transduction histidine kinase
MNLLTINSTKDLDVDVSRALKLNGGDYEINTKSVDSFDDLERAIKSQPWHAIFCNCHTPGFSSVDDLIRLKKISEKVPIFILSESSAKQEDILIMEVGVDDFVITAKSDSLTSVLEKLLQNNNSPSAKKDMLSMVYHDIKNPISAIQLDAQMLEILSEKKFYPEMLSDIKIQSRRIIRTVNRIKKLISDLLDHSSSNSLSQGERSFVIHKQFNDPQEVINEVIETFGPLLDDKKIKLFKKISNINTRAFFDKDRLAQVISNLLSNAIKFSPFGESIYLDLKFNELKELIFSIEDSGPGIDEIYLPHVFDKFWTNGTGHGLGLFICKEIIEGHGGKINVSNTKNHGARFEFSIPPFNTELFQLDSDNVSLELEQDNLIFVIDDDDDLRDVITWALEKESYNVISFSNPLKAIQVLHQLTHAPKLIILDFNLEGMTGEDFLRIKMDSLNSFFHHCPVVMISASQYEILNNLDPKLYDIILQKPIDLRKLLDTVNLKTHFLNQ